MTAIYKHFMAVLLLLGAAGANAQAEREAIVTAVQSHLAEMLSHIPAGQEAGFGFSTRAEFTACTAG